MDRVDDRYRLVLGEGAVGAVWLAHDERRDIDVALKILRPKHVATKEMIARFVREAELSERMLSPHIVRVLARGATADGAPYIAYEYLDGRDLAEHIGSTGRLSLEGARTVVVHTCRALARAHSMGVLHRDIKPENLFVTKSEERMLLKVLDFRVAEIVAAADRDGDIGTRRRRRGPCATSIPRSRCRWTNGSSRRSPAIPTLASRTRGRWRHRWSARWRSST